MYDNITIFYKDAEVIITPFSAGRVIKLLKKRIANGEETAQNYTFLADAYLTKKDNKKAFKYVLKAKKIDLDYYYADVVSDSSCFSISCFCQCGFRSQKDQCKGNDCRLQ